MKRKTLCGLLAALLVLSLLPTAASAAAEASPAEKAAVLRELDILVGDETGDLQLDRAVTRAEFTKLLVAASTRRGSVGDTAATNPYPDVSYTQWYAPYVRVAVDAGLVQGDLEGYFRPLRTITLAEGATMLVRLLGYSDAEFSSYRWPAGQMALFRTLDLGAGAALTDPEAPLTRRDCLHLFYNLLTVKNKGGAPYITLLGHTLDRDGLVDLPALLSVEREGPIPLTGDYRDLLPFDLRDALIYRDEARASLSDLREWDLLYWAKDRAILFALSAGAMSQLSAGLEGPVEAEGDWASLLPFSPDQAGVVTRNGRPAAYDDIRPGDLIYYSKYARALYVYARRVSGTVEAVAPSAAAPASVTVAGQTYPLETLAAQYALSDMGTFRVGDPVTLLLGRSGGAAAVRPLAEPDVRLAVLAALTTRVYTDEHNAPYSAQAVTVTAADGCRYTYPFRWEDTDLAVGDLVRVTLDGESVRIDRAAPQALPGRVDAAGLRVGEAPLAPDVAILDTAGAQTAFSVPLSRLDGVELTAGMVRGWTTDDRGAVNALILRDVTGDSHTYGILTDIRRLNATIPTQGILLQDTYTYDVGGAQYLATVSGKSFSLDKGPFCLQTDGGQVTRVFGLTPLAGVTLSGRTACTDAARATLSDAVLYYRFDPGANTYTSATREELLADGCVLTAWYDAPDAAGGRVRIVTGAPRPTL